MAAQGAELRYGPPMRWQGGKQEHAFWGNVVKEANIRSNDPLFYCFLSRDTMALDQSTYWQFPYTSQRVPVLADNVVSTSQPLAAAAGLKMLMRGGNAVDAALATAIALTVVEPCMNGIGGDLFALIWDGKQMHGLNASGRAPAAWTPDRFADQPSMPGIGWGSVTTPGGVAGWRALCDRFGTLPFEDLFEPAVKLARDGFLVSPTVHRQWQEQVGKLSSQPGYADAFAPQGEHRFRANASCAPGRPTHWKKLPAAAGMLFYHGELAAAIAAHARNTGGLITEADLAANRPDWVDPYPHRLPRPGIGGNRPQRPGLSAH